MDSKLLNEIDGLKIAIEIEKRGHEFYQHAYSQAKKDEHKELFLLLRDEENHHMIKFQTVLDKVKANNGSCVVEFAQDTSKYLAALFAEHVFPKAEDAAAVVSKFKTMEDILATAMQAEKDSILLYDELSQKSKSAEAVKIFSALKAEEQRHVLKLREIIDGWA